MECPPDSTRPDGTSPAREADNDHAAPPTGDGTAVNSEKRQTIWCEVFAVMAVGVVPNLVGAVSALTNPVPVPPYWLDAFSLTVISGCTILVTVYLIARSGEPWARFGMSRPRVSDVPLGLLMFFVAAGVLIVLPVVPDFGLQVNAEFSRPQAAGEFVLMVVKYAAAAFSEELVTRAYLVTRLTTLLRSRCEAVVAAAAVFASYHIYQGGAGAAYSFTFGLAYGAAFLAIRRVWPLALGHAGYNVGLELLYL